MKIGYVVERRIKTSTVNFSATIAVTTDEKLAKQIKHYLETTEGEQGCSFVIMKQPLFDEFDTLNDFKLWWEE